MSIGEILDRAISTYVRRCLPLFVILAIVIVPVTLLQLAAAPGFAHVSDVFAEMNRLPVSDTLDRNRLMGEALRGINAGSIFALFVLWPVILFPLTRNAVYTYADGALEHTPVSIAAAYRASFARWFAQIVVVIGYIAIACAIGIALILVYALILVVVFLVAGRGTAAGIAFVIVTDSVVPRVLSRLCAFERGVRAFEREPRVGSE